MAGDYAATRRLAEAAGVVVADTLEDFEDLARLFLALRGRRPAGARLGALSNAGFECVAIADNLGAFTLADFAPATAAAMGEVLKRARIAEIVSVHDPMDLTPIMDDADTEEILRLILADPGVDLGIAGLVPLTQAWNSLAKGEGHGEDVTRRGVDREPDGAALPRDHEAVGRGGGRGRALRPDGGPDRGGRRAGLPRRRPGAAAVQPLGRGGDAGLTPTPATPSDQVRSSSAAGRSRPGTPP